MEQDQMVPGPAVGVVKEWAKVRDRAGWVDLGLAPAEDVYVRAAGQRALTSAACLVRRPHVQTAAL